MSNEENWKWIEGYEGHYKISNFGRVFSVKSNIFLSVKRITKDGYNYVALSKDNKPKEMKTHRLVATYFIPNPDNKETVNHIDGNKLNNHVDNLEWCTRHENMQHAYKLGLKKMHRGHEHASSKLTPEQIKEIRATYKPYKKGCSALALGKKYGVHNSTILRIVKNESYVENV